MANKPTARSGGVNGLSAVIKRWWFQVKRQKQLLPVLCCAWLFVSCIWLAVEPRYSMRMPAMEPIFIYLPIAISIALTCCVAVDAFIQLLRHGQHQIVLGDVCFLLMLFTITFLQLSTHSDALHFAHDFVATPLDWLLFSFGNALRAADLADTLKDFGVYVPQITANSWTACSLLIGYRLIIDILFLSYALVTVNRIREWLVETLTDTVSETIIMQIYFLSWVALIGCWTLTAFWWSPWQSNDLILWPLDNLLRVFDIFDGMQIFGVRLDSIPNGRAEIALGIAFRVLVAVALAKPVDWMQKRMVKSVKRVLRYFTGKETDPTQADKREAAWDLRLALCGVATFAMGLLMVAMTRHSTHRILVTAATDQHDTTAYQIIQRLGINCAPHTMHALHTVAADQHQRDAERLQAISTLGHFGIASVDILTEVLGDNPSLRDAALNSLVEVGPSSSPALIAVLEECEPGSRDFAIETLKAWGGDAVSYLASSVDADNAVYYYTLFDSIDPYWYGRRGSGAWFKQLVHSKKCSIWLDPAVNRLFAKTANIAVSRARGEAIQAIIVEMKWSPPPVAKALVQVVAFQESTRYGEMRHHWNETGRRASTTGGPVPHGASAETDGVRQAKNHLTNVARKNPESAIDVFLEHLNSDNSMYQHAAQTCLQRVCGNDYVQLIHEHRKRGIQGRAFQVDTKLAIRPWSAPDVRQILIESGLPNKLEILLPVHPRDQLSLDDANDLVEVLASRSPQVWIDVLAELGQQNYPSPVVAGIVTASALHPSPDIRLKACDHYPQLDVGPTLIRDHLSSETDADVIIRILEVAAEHGALARSVAPLTTKFADTTSRHVAESAAETLITAQQSAQLAMLADENELFRDQLLDRIDEVERFSDVEDVYLKLMRGTPLTENQIARLIDALSNQEEAWGDAIVTELFGYQSDAARQFAIVQLLKGNSDQQARLFQLLAAESDPSRIAFCFAEIREFIRQSHPELLPDKGDLVAPQHDQNITAHRDSTAILKRILSTASMENADTRRQGIALISDLAAPIQQSSLPGLYAQLKVEADPQIRRAVLDLFSNVPPQGVNGIIAWRPQETNPELAQYLDGVIRRHKQETARIAQEHRQQLERDKLRLAELTARLKQASAPEAKQIQTELADHGNLAIDSLDQMLRDQKLDNHQAVDVAMATLIAIGPDALPTLTLHAQNPNAFVWRKALNAMLEFGPSSEIYFRKLLSHRRPELQKAALSILEKFEELDLETLKAMLPLLTVEAAGVDLAALTVLRNHEASNSLLRQVGENPNVRKTLRQIIHREVAAKQ